MEVKSAFDLPSFQEVLNEVRDNLQRAVNLIYISQEFGAGNKDFMYTTKSIEKSLKELKPLIDYATLLLRKDCYNICTEVSSGKTGVAVYVVSPRKESSSIAVYIGEPDGSEDKIVPVSEFFKQYKVTGYADFDCEV